VISRHMNGSVFASLFASVVSFRPNQTLRNNPVTTATLGLEAAIPALFSL
jgi:hypothetical protein